MIKKVTVLCFTVLLSVFSGITLSAKEYKAAVKQLPTTDYFVKLLKSVVEATGNTVAVQVVPPARADYLIANNEVDIQLPIVVPPDPAKQKALKYDFSTVVLVKQSWVLYVNKSKPLDVDSLRNGNSKKYKIEIDPSRTDDYNFVTMGSSNFEASFKKLSDGTIDGVILSQTTGDPLLKKGAYKNITRQLWSELDQCFSLQKGARGGEIDKMLTLGVNKMKADGSYDKLVGDYSRKAKFDNWQP
jgi:polar amino acid transport system substrate-binding protein